MIYRGPCAKANVGMSNDKAGEKPAHRKAKGSRDNVNRSGVSRVLRNERERNSDGEPVNIPAPALWGLERDGWLSSSRTDGSVRLTTRKCGKSRVLPSGETEQGGGCSKKISLDINS